MRALLVVNPRATTTSRRVLDVMAGALASEAKLETAHTAGRGHAGELAAQAADEGLDVVAVFGGDGTVNEVVNGLLHAGPGGHVPALGLLPGGSTNVLARALGLPTDPVEAAGTLLAGMRDGTRRRIGLGRADDRWFTANTGLGIDAEVVRRVERARAAGRRASHPHFVRTAVRAVYGTDRRRPGPLTLEIAGQPAAEGVHAAFVQNTRPWTYLGRRPVDPSPRASFDCGLDVLALRALGTVSTLRLLRRMLTGRPPAGRAALALHDLPGLVLRAERPLPLQVDGDDAGDRESVRLVAVPDALAVVV